MHAIFCIRTVLHIVWCRMLGASQSVSGWNITLYVIRVFDWPQWTLSFQDYGYHHVFGSSAQISTPSQSRGGWFINKKMVHYCFNSITHFCGTNVPTNLGQQRRSKVSKWAAPHWWLKANIRSKTTAHRPQKKKLHNSQLAAEADKSSCGQRWHKKGKQLHPRWSDTQHAKA